MTTKSRTFVLPETGALVFHLVMRSGHAWYQLDWDDKESSLHIPVKAIPALRELINEIDRAEERATPEAPCTGVGCMLSFPHTNNLHYINPDDQEVQVGPRGMNREERIQAQIAHLSEPQNRAKVEHHIGGTDIAGYMRDYADQWDLYQALCNDVDISPRVELFHPNPED